MRKNNYKGFVGAGPATGKTGTGASEGKAKGKEILHSPNKKPFVDYKGHVDEGPGATK